MSIDDKNKIVFSPFHTALQRFKSDKMAQIGFFGILILVSVAVFAPLIANGRPIILYRNGSLHSPMAHFLFAPDSSETIVEQCFNYLLFLIPFSICTFIFLKKKIKIALYLIAGFGLVLLIPFFMTSQKLDKKDWRQVSTQLVKGEFAIFAPIPYGPFENIAKPYQRPSSTHIFGTDKIGRDVFARMLYGARVSLAVGIFATSIAIFFGTLIGLSAGYYGGGFDIVTMRIVEIVICFPTFLLLLILMAIMQDYRFNQSILLVIAVIGFTSWTGLSRIVRGETLKLRSLPYIQSCESLAIPTWRILLFHILPNVLGPIMISFSFGVAGAIIAESSLSFLGFGVQAPTASWGELLRQALDGPFSYWHLTLWPGIALFISVISFNFAGEGLRKSLDPKS
jgi:peptide/nickel transport system permease protein